MSQTLPRPMTADEFLAWDTLQPDARHELIDGVPVARAGATLRHDAILGNVFGHLWQQLRGQSCCVFSPSLALRMPNGNVRRADVGVRCPPFDSDALFAATPVLVVEVLSPLTRSVDLARKLEEYWSVPSMRFVLLIEPDMPQVTSWSRAEYCWVSRMFDGLDKVVPMTELALCLTLANIYEGLSFAPRLVG